MTGTVALADLAPHISPPGGRTQRLDFLCPNCRKATIGVDIWSAPSGNLKVDEHTIHVWHAEQGPLKDWATLTLTPSVDSVHGYPGEPPHGCSGWHGHITNGVCTW